MTRASSLIVAIALTAAAARAGAQPAAWTDRGYVSAGADVRVVATNFGDVIHPIDFAEAAVVNTTYKMRIAPGIEIGGGARVWRNLAIGATATWVSRPDAGSVDAQVPHPFVFGKPRAVSGDASLGRNETAVHVQALWMMPLTARWQLAVAGGPSWMSLRQDLVDDVTVTQTYPYDTATYAGVHSQRISKSHAGFNAGVDATYLFRPRVGVGLSAAFSRARIPLSPSASTDVGGLHVNGGLRVRF
jgi:Outer membrane protein beta-barrel domain